MNRVQLFISKSKNDLASSVFKDKFKLHISVDIALFWALNYSLFQFSKF